MKISNLYIITILTLIFSSCEKEESPIVLPEKNDSAYLVTVNMGEYYKQEVFVNIETGQSWTADNESWDLQFESDADGYLVKMNGGKRVLIGSAGTGMLQNQNGIPVRLRWDNSSGMRDSIVLGQWADPVTRISRDSVYIIDRGEACSPNDRYFQFQIRKVDHLKYMIRYADIDGNNLKDINVMKNPDKLHVYFTFANGGNTLDFEPNKSDWHFCFLRYRWIYYEFNPPLLYSVCGVHINTSKIEVAVDSTMQYNAILRSHVTGLHYTDVRDVVGFDWKVPDFSSPTGVKYNARKYVNYIVREKHDYSKWFKLHFIGFYNQTGIKGTPQFEVEKLVY